MGTWFPGGQNTHKSVYTWPTYCPLQTSPHQAFLLRRCCGILLSVPPGDPQAVPQRCSSRVITRTWVCEGYGTYAHGGLNRRCCEDATKTLHHHAAHTPRPPGPERKSKPGKWGVKTHTSAVPSLKAERSSFHRGLMGRDCRLHERGSNLIKRGQRHIWGLTACPCAAHTG